ncbi:MAG: hypothetical protein JSS81_28300 [Acidobacteria bacterium]|nr:hypothetical protein [Acidobacteriota bacterium]
MSLRHQQDLLARLYTDAEFRAKFLSDPQAGGREYELSAAETDEIATIVPEELEFFSETLFWKRLRETEKLLPLTKKALADEFSGYFRRFSGKFQPKTVKKHLEDAVAFCGYLRKSAGPDDLTKDLAGYERARLVFFGSGRRIIVRRLRFDLRRLPEIGRNPFSAENFPRRQTIAVWLRTGGKTRHFLI